MKPQTRRLPLLVLGVVLAGAGLTACAPLLVGGAVVTGMSAADRRTTGSQIEDERIETRGATRLREHLGERVHINITSYNRQVLLTGEVPNEQDKQLAEQVVSRIENVRSITNELAVLGHSTLTQRSSDALVTGRVKANLIDAKDLNSSAFKVVTERGVVYLLGRVTPREADRATDIARRTSGVQKVVRLFELITEEELLEMQAPANTAPGTTGSGRTM
ncbi:MAG: BON domain-containing protein [Hylemonella sp.]|uniref:BON domain-containing protein n=1 Tax=Hylemonella sp. TaxID=2066020 RepID=UPI0022C4CA27|nr:BON domain-containing protein [Hylemonella sp.]MCZ8253355.1 BON domain-containing protein [Hylemonella sp.]